MVIVDTTVWIDYVGGILNAETEWLDREMPLQRLGLTDMILCEVLQGIREAREFQQIRDQLLTADIPSARPSTAGSLRSVCLLGINCCTATAILMRARRCWGCRWCTPEMNLT